MNQDKFRKLTQLIIDYFLHQLSESTAEDPEEWKCDAQLKFDRVYEEVERLLGFPSFAESQRQLMEKDVDFEAHIKALMVRNAKTSKLTSEIMALCTKSTIQLLDLPIEKKAQLLAGNDAAFEDGLLAAELHTANLFHQQLKKMEAQGLL
jgi:hypothetical protein